MKRLERNKYSLKCRFSKSIVTCAWYKTFDFVASPDSATTVDTLCLLEASTHASQGEGIYPRGANLHPNTKECVIAVCEIAVKDCSRENPFLFFVTPLAFKGRPTPNGRSPKAILAATPLFIDGNCAFATKMKELETQRLRTLSRDTDPFSQRQQLSTSRLFVWQFTHSTDVLSLMHATWLHQQGKLAMSKAFELGFACPNVTATWNRFVEASTSIPTSNHPSLPIGEFNQRLACMALPLQTVKWSNVQQLRLQALDGSLHLAVSGSRPEIVSRGSNSLGGSKESKAIYQSNRSSIVSTCAWVWEEKMTSFIARLGKWHTSLIHDGLPTKGIRVFVRELCPDTTLPRQTVPHANVDPTDANLLEMHVQIQPLCKLNDACLTTPFEILTPTDTLPYMAEIKCPLFVDSSATHSGHCVLTPISLQKLCEFLEVQFADACCQIVSYANNNKLRITRLEFANITLYHSPQFVQLLDAVLRQTDSGVSLLDIDSSVSSLHTVAFSAIGCIEMPCPPHNQPPSHLLHTLVGLRNSGYAVDACGLNTPIPDENPRSSFYLLPQWQPTEIDLWRFHCALNRRLFLQKQGSNGQPLVYKPTQSSNESPSITIRLLSSDAKQRELDKEQELRKKKKNTSLGLLQQVVYQQDKSSTRPRNLFPASFPVTRYNSVAAIPLINENYFPMTEYLLLRDYANIENNQLLHLNVFLQRQNIKIEPTDVAYTRSLYTLTCQLAQKQQDVELTASVQIDLIYHNNCVELCMDGNGESNYVRNAFA